MATGPDDVSDHRRYAIIAGSGRIPVDLARYLTEKGQPPFVFLLEGDADQALTAYDHVVINTSQMGKLVSTARGEQITHIVLVGGVRGRPDPWQLRPDRTTLKLVPKVIRLLLRGDDALLAGVVSMLEESGFAVVGVHDVMPDIVASHGVMGQMPVPRGLDGAIKTGVQAARMLGAMDAGQGIVIVGRRIVALEGAEGTDQMVRRIAELKSAGRLHDRKGGVLVKLAKPGQELRVDMPAIGVATIHNAAEAKLEGIVVEAEKTLIVDRQAVIEEADGAGLFVTGVTAPERQADNDQ